MVMNHLKTSQNINYVMNDKLHRVWEEVEIQLKFECWANDTAATSKQANSCD
jgi:hypothetical protein